MKLILPVILALSTLWVTNAAMAQTLYERGFNDIQSQFLETYPSIDRDISLNDFPQYAASNQLASLPRHFNTGGERVFVFSPRSKAWAAYDSDGYKVAGGRANGGANFCADVGRPCRSPVGSHRVYSKGSVECVSNKYPVGQGGAAMPYCMFFRGGYAIHGSPYISNRNGSHGCIRVQTGAAKWLHRYFIRPGTKVVVLPY